MTKDIPHYKITAEIVSNIDLLMKSEYSKIEKVRNEIMDKWMRKCLLENGISPDQSIEIINIKMMEQGITVTHEYDSMMNMPLIWFNEIKTEVLAFDFRMMNDKLVLMTNFNPDEDDAK